MKAKETESKRETKSKRQRDFKRKKDEGDADNLLERTAITFTTKSERLGLEWGK